VILSNRNLLVAVTGGIAAYKICELVRQLMKAGASLRVIMSPSATRFVTPLTFEALTGKKVVTDMFNLESESGGHLEVVNDIDLMVIAPATANIIGKLSSGIADDLISTASLALTKPLLICPAMNPKMFANPVVQENLARLKSRGVIVMDPDEGPMASPSEDPGIGRLPEPPAIYDRICKLFQAKNSLEGRAITVTAGPTQEMIDPVRVMTNLSSGRMGYALAEEAQRRGARVNLIAGPVCLPDPPGISTVHIENTEQLSVAIKDVFKDSDVLIMSAAPSDFRCSEKYDKKLKKDNTAGAITLKLDQNPDIIKQVSKHKGNRIVIGLALETGDGTENATRKLHEKNLDLIILNHPNVSDDTGIGKDSIIGTLINSKGTVNEFPKMTKMEFAGKIFDYLESLLSRENP